MSLPSSRAISFCAEFLDEDGLSSISLDDPEVSSPSTENTGSFLGKEEGFSLTNTTRFTNDDLDLTL
jgi:hypothetical protein